MSAGLRGIAVSGFGTDEDVQQCMDAGFTRHLTKPIDVAKLEMAIYQTVGSAA